MYAEKREAPAGTGIPTRAAGKGLPTSFPASQFIVYSGRRQPKIADLLHVGAENGMTLRELVRLTGEDERLIRRRIQAERKSGALILADCKSGYFLPADANDVRRFIRSMSRRAREISAVSRAAEDALSRMEGQETLGGW